MTTKTSETICIVSKYGVFSGPNAGKYGPEKTPYVDTFHAVRVPLRIPSRHLLASKVAVWIYFKIALLKVLQNPKPYSEPYQLFMMELFCENC